MRRNHGVVIISIANRAYQMLQTKASQMTNMCPPQKGVGGWLGQAAEQEDSRC